MFLTFDAPMFARAAGYRRQGLQFGAIVLDCRARCVTRTGTTPQFHNDKERLFMDATAIGAVLSVIGSIIVFVFLGVRINQLMKSCNSEK